MPAWTAAAARVEAPSVASRNDTFDLFDTYDTSPERSAGREGAQNRLRRSIFLASDMTVLQKITRSKDPAVFTLYREGLFYKCYNEDAMV